MFNIYRIEHRDTGIGVHQSRLFNRCEWWTEVIERHNNFPTPEEDGLDLKSCHFCATETVEEIQNMFTRYELGYILPVFRVYCIAVSKFIAGDTYNIIFEKEDIIEKIDITDKVFL